jgi:polyphosphate glucokinase
MQATTPAVVIQGTGESLHNMDVLVIDVGGTHVKLLATGAAAPRRFDSGADLTPQTLVARARETAADWRYDVVSLGIPGAVDVRGARKEPGNLGDGWIGFAFEDAFGKPVRIVNDAVMQALGGYDGGRMLFLGLGTGLGSALVSEHVVVPLELGGLPYGEHEILYDRLGRKGLDKYGEAAWQATVTEAVNDLREAFCADYVVLGGGNAERVQTLPPATRRGGNEDAFKGGFMLWEELVEPHDQEPARVWRVVR